MQKSTKNKEKVLKSNKNQAENIEKYYHSEEEDRVIVSAVLNEFERRRNERKPFDLTWELNINFLMGNQFSYISDKGEIEKSPKQYYWQGEEVFNHISPIIETRLAKLSKVRPSCSVKPTSNSDRDIYCAKLSKNILSSFSNKQKLSEKISRATLWSEVCGTAFYKVVWDNDLGESVGEDNGKQIMLGDASVSVCSPFEIFPYSNADIDFDEMQSLIHACPMPAKFIEEKYNIKIHGEDIDTFSFDQFSSPLTYTGKSNVTKLARSVMHDHALVIEYYEKPTSDYKNGRLIIVAGNNLVYDGDLPFVSKDNNKRVFPFVKQVSSDSIGSFWGTSVIERCIPVQRAFNTLKNRKHEFMARLASGVLAVEDGSVDLDLIEEEGLAPGKIVVYRNGSTPPRFMDHGSIPNEFDSEEDRLLNEFITISGVSEFMRDSAVPSSVSSGTALSLLIEQDETRLSVTAENIRMAVKDIAGHVIDLYKQFASSTRLINVTDETGEIESFYWNSGDVSSDEIVLETVNELTQSPAQRKSLLFDLYKSGIFTDSNGKVSSRVKTKLIEALGFNEFETMTDISPLHSKKAIEENLRLTQEKLIPADFDDHEIHIAEHTKFLLSDGYNIDNLQHRENIQNHIIEHKVLLFASSATSENNLNGK